jgi:predicted PurR-regulated permease PerM
MTTPWSGAAARVAVVAGLFIVVAGLRLGKELFVPLALSVLFSLVLSPLVRWIQKVGVPRVVSVVSVVVLVFGLLALVGLFIVGQAAALGRRFPEYRANVMTKLDSLRGPLARTVRTVEKALKDIQAPPAEDKRSPQEPVKVEVVEGPPDVLKIATLVLGPLMTAGASFAVVFLLVIFFLLYQDEIRDRVIRLAGSAEVNATTQTITEATQGVSRFLFLQAFVNASYGATLGLGLFVLGVPNALLWGFLAALARFVPYVGPVVGGVLPVLMSLAVFPGWSRPIGVGAFIVVLEVISNNLVEPVVYGKRTGLSPLAVVVAAVFWAWMWGGLGLLLSVPLTVCLVSLGRHIPSLNFLAVLFGDEPTLEPKVRIYQRLLSGQQEEAAEVLEKDVEAGKPLAAVFDATLLGVLRMAQADLRRGKLEPEDAERLFASVREIVDDVSDVARAELEKKREGAPAPVRGASALCLPASDAADEISAEILARVLHLRGCRAKALPADHTAGEALEAVAAERADLLVLCASPHSNLLRARYLYKRLRRRFGDIPIVEGVWGYANPRTIEARVAPDHKAVLVTSLAEAADLVERLTREAGLRKDLRDGAA